jgi:hypothetical protein
MKHPRSGSLFKAYPLWDSTQTHQGRRTPRAMEHQGSIEFCRPYHSEHALQPPDATVLAPFIELERSMHQWVTRKEGTRDRR